MARPKGRNQISDKGLTNEQTVVLALANLRGDVQVVDTEDIALEADKIAPGRFRWKKYAEFINNELVHTALRDAKRLSGLVRGAGSEGWQLTTSGLELVRELKKQGITSVEARPALDPKQRAWLRHERVRLLSDVAYEKYCNGGINEITRREAEHFFRIDEYVVGEAREARLQRIANAFGEDPELGAAVKTLAAKLHEGPLR